MPQNLKAGLFATTTMIGTAMAYGKNKAAEPTTNNLTTRENTEDLRKTTDLRNKLTESEKHKDTVNQMMIGDEFN